MPAFDTAEQGGDTYWKKFGSSDKAEGATSGEQVTNRVEYPLFDDNPFVKQVEQFRKVLAAAAESLKTPEAAKLDAGSVQQIKEFVETGRKLLWQHDLSAAKVASPKMVAERRALYEASAKTFRTLVNDAQNAPALRNLFAKATTLTSAHDAALAGKKWNGISMIVATKPEGASPKAEEGFETTTDWKPKAEPPKQPAEKASVADKPAPVAAKIGDKPIAAKAENANSKPAETKAPAQNAAASPGAQKPVRRQSM